ncbi:polysaccharide deacetylase family protein [Sphaerisporangium sp. NPDC005288]|uniref:polysaccharide deacetylase family protein n=1 Tax=Sphaerisporangium sp. NPDC005288 TaxID=3155114 RepID=UPI0033AC2F55
MLYGGITWTATGYEICVIDGDTGEKVDRERFQAADILRMFDYVSGLREVHRRPVSMIIDSSNGMVDGTMTAAGLDVYRADPWLLPAASALGSADAPALAQSARRDLPKLARLDSRHGTLTGRLDELDAGIEEARRAETELTAAGHCVSHGGRDRRQIALTFDDGPHPLFTGRVLEILRHYDVPATFFCVGLHASGHPELIARMSDAGHLLGNHTWSHPFLPDLTKDQIAGQIAHTARHLPSGREGAPALFRPPYGSRTSAILSWLVDLETTTVLWDVEPFDWAMPGTDVIVGRVLAEARAGSIVLLHDGGGDRSQTVAALPRIIEGLLDQDYRLVTIDALTRP